MDLRLFHPEDGSNRSYKTMDRFNSRADINSCHFLETMGWYHTSMPTLLLGHYRFFQLHRRQQSIPENDQALVNGYILLCKAEFKIKTSLNIPAGLFYNFWHYPLPSAKIYHIDQRLQNEQALILHEFLINADADFEKALHRAIEQINSPAFLAMPVISNSPPPNIVFQIKTDHNTHNYNHTFHSHNELNIHPVIREEAPSKEDGLANDQPVPSNASLQGKQKDVFSKKQILIFFDLLSKSGKIDPLELSNPNKHPLISELLHSFTGKSKETWLEELQNYRSKGLYAVHDKPELDNLLNTLQNLAAAFCKAGQIHLVKLVENKIKELKKAKG